MVCVCVCLRLLVFGCGGVLCVFGCYAVARRVGCRQPLLQLLANRRAQQFQRERVRWRTTTQRGRGATSKQPTRGARGTGRQRQRHRRILLSALARERSWAHAPPLATCWLFISSPSANTQPTTNSLCCMLFSALAPCTRLTLARPHYKQWICAHTAAAASACSYLTLAHRRRASFVSMASNLNLNQQAGAGTGAGAGSSAGGIGLGGLTRSATSRLSLLFTPPSSSWASADLRAYQARYPGQRQNVHASKNLDFYCGRIPSAPRPAGLIDAIHIGWRGDYDLLEAHHGYIQWLFPIREDGLNSQAQMLYLHEIKGLVADAGARQRLIVSYRLMLDFYGMQLADESLGLVVRANNYEPRYAHLNRSMHNYLRITRILKCLGELGREELKLGFLLHVVKELVAGQLKHGSVGKSAVNYCTKLTHNARTTNLKSERAHGVMLNACSLAPLCSALCFACASFRVSLPARPRRSRSSAGRDRRAEEGRDAGGQQRGADGRAHSNRAGGGTSRTSTCCGRRCCFFCCRH